MCRAVCATGKQIRVCALFNYNRPTPTRQYVTNATALAAEYGRPSTPTILPDNPQSPGCVANMLNTNKYNTAPCACHGHSQKAQNGCAIWRCQTVRAESLLRATPAYSTKRNQRCARHALTLETAIILQTKSKPNYGIRWPHSSHTARAVQCDVHARVRATARDPTNRLRFFTTDRDLPRVPKLVGHTRNTTCTRVLPVGVAREGLWARNTRRRTRLVPHTCNKLNSVQRRWPR